MHAIAVQVGKGDDGSGAGDSGVTGLVAGEVLVWS
jgi:hypothetical protein